MNRKWPTADDLLAWDIWSWLRATENQEKSPSDIKDRLADLSVVGALRLHWSLYNGSEIFRSEFLPPDTPVGDIQQ